MKFIAPGKPGELPVTEHDDKFARVMARICQILKIFPAREDGKA